MNLFLDIFTKVFFILSPFFSVSMFLLLSDDMDHRARHRCALRTSMAILTICFLVYFFGNLIFRVLGITVPAFQVGAGTLLFLASIQMMMKLTGLILTAIAAQIIFTGVNGFLHGTPS